MKANNDKQLDKFIDKLMQETLPESPSPEFTSKLMLQVQATEMEKAAVYKPLISKRAWFIIFAVIIALTGYFIFNTDIRPGSWLASLDRINVNDDIMKMLPAFKFSTITLYAVVLLPVMLFVQITMLKKYFNRQYH
jgi:hypothetical protein